MRDELGFCGLKYHFVAFAIQRDDRKPLTWSSDAGAYVQPKRQSSMFWFDRVSADNGQEPLRLSIRKIQLVLVEKERITKKLIGRASRVGIRAEETVRRQLSIGSKKMAPQAYVIDVASGFLQEEFIRGETLMKSHTFDDAVEAGFSAYQVLVGAGVASDVNVLRQYSVYERKLKVMSKRLRNEILSSYLEKALEQVKGTLRSLSTDSTVRYINLVHGDFNPHSNLIVNALGETKLIDWEHSTHGPLMFDFVYFLLQLQLEPEEFSRLLCQKAALMLSSRQELNIQLSMCFLMLVIMKLNLWERKDHLSERALGKRLNVLERAHSQIKFMSI